mgnify:FL=1
MKSLLFVLLLFISLINKSYSKEVSSVRWSYAGDTAYNSCMMIISFICSMEQDVESDVSNASINQFIVIYNKKNELIKKFKVKKIEYTHGRCWITPQPIRNYKTYFTTNKCEVVRD